MRAPAPTLSREEMLRAMYARDAAYDGTFFFAVVSTGVFCFPSCPSRKPRPEEEAELLVKIASLIREQDGAIDVATLARRVAISPHYLQHLFRRLTGSSLYSYITRHRVQRAVQLLRETDFSILDIADLTGFRSLSGFYDFFLRSTGVTPGAFRQQAGPRQREEKQGG